jgi:Protein of unknown function (DUF3826)
MIRVMLMPFVCLMTLASLAGAEPAGTSVPTTSPADDYEAVIAGRATKIVDTLGMTDPEAVSRVHSTVTGFYRSLRVWDDHNGAERKQLKRDASDESKARLAALDAQLAAIRADFIQALAADLTPGQIDKVKDGLTFNVVHVTYKAYNEQILTLTPEQNTQIMAWLVEARDLAISEGSSEAKHAVFGKYKGRINNYLSKQGYDLKQSQKEWAERRKAATRPAGQ